MTTAPHRLLARLRETMAGSAAPLAALPSLIAAELGSEVCSIYTLRPGEILELVATVGLTPSAVGRTRLRVGEGVVGLVAATGLPLNLPDAQNHPAFAYRPETGEEPYASMLAVPVRRAGQLRGVLVVQNRLPRLFAQDEADALETVAMLLAELLPNGRDAAPPEEGFGAALSRRFAATPLAPGLVIGTVLRRGVLPQPARLLAEDIVAEQARLEKAWRAMHQRLDALLADRLPEPGAPREVLEAYRLVAADAGWFERMATAVKGGLTAEAAVHRVAVDLRRRMRRLGDPYLRERLADLEDLAGRLLDALGTSLTPSVLPPGTILLARRLGAAELIDWHARGVIGLVVEEGTPHGHAAILARALCLPALGGAQGLIETANDGEEAVLDADEGRMILRPELDVTQSYRTAMAARTEQQTVLLAWRKRAAATADGIRLRLMLNLGLPREIEQLAATGADGVGLFRTEIAMMAAGAVPDVAEQAAIYARVLDAAAGSELVFRTLDLGSDKLLPGAPPPVESNPAMGWRSLRVGLDRPAVLRRQLRALLLAADGRPLSVMFPMVATVEEFQAARALLEAELARIGRKPERLSVGTMLEVPALLWQIPGLLAAVDFISVGTNDLMQFLFAADRTAPGIAGRYDVLSAPVLDLLETLAEQAEAAGVALSVCGDAAGDPVVALTLAALGITTLSMSAQALLPLKAWMARMDLASFRPVLGSIRRAATGGASLRETIAAWMREQNPEVTPGETAAETAAETADGGGGERRI
ncbi:MAG TPA: putative PEP-binding protein [Acetobacteraceae bacterium]|nr:putative PEP-binding protein [Acetobacteraceae bacterium]